MTINFPGRIFMIGSGAVSRCLQPLILRHINMDFKKLTILDPINISPYIADTLAAGAKFIQKGIVPENLAEILSENVSAGDLVIDLSVNVDTGELIDWCQKNDVLYINTSVELWEPYSADRVLDQEKQTLYERHMHMRQLAKNWSANGPTAVVEHGANPGLVSHWTKQALEGITQEILKISRDKERNQALEHALFNQDFAQLAMLTGTKVIHISERDTQITNEPKKVNEFVNTWSIDGLYEEGIAPAELGWGTHEKQLPHDACQFNYGPRNQIFLKMRGIDLHIRSWVPMGDIIGMLIRHGEAFTISDYLTVWHENKAIYRPTVHYVYLPSNAAFNSVHEFKMRHYQLQESKRIMNREIIEGNDELGVLLLGHDLNGWWTGSHLDIHETRKLVGNQNATTLQVAASLLGAIFWMIKNPNKGYNIPDQLPYKEVLDVANLYLGPCSSRATNWNPLKNRVPADNLKDASGDDIWQFSNFRVNNC